MFSSKKLDEIIDNTISVIEQSKNEIFEIAEMSRAEYARVEAQLEEMKALANKVIEQVDQKEREFRLARVRLMQVSRDFDRHDEETIKQAYEEAQAVQLELVVLREREVQLRSQRDELERSLRTLLATVKKAERLTMQVGVAMEYLRGNLEDLGGKLGGMKQRHLLGVRVIKAQEEERRRIARDIHDGPAQTLANVILRAEICEKLLETDMEQVRCELRQLKESVRAGLKDIRKVIYDLRPMTLDDLGLVPTLRRFVTEFQHQYKVIADFVVTGSERRLPAHLEVGLFRIVQEALNNVGQHAQASSALVRLDFGDTNLGLLVKDDGCVFDVNEVMQRDGDHFGLLSMRERTELLQGTWHLHSAPDQGTKLLIRIPLQEVEDDGY
ncbi:MAG: histidine kinase [Firmicutes bacterium]|nr:histidine kinase [Bacillota bacterium]